MPINLNSSTVAATMAMFDTETVTVTRQSKGATPGTFTTTTIYSGAGDLQVGTGSTFMGPGGVEQQVDGFLTLDPVAGVLPAIAIGDLVAFGSQTFTIIDLSAWTFPIAHVAATLKLGRLTNKPLK